MNRSLEQKRTSFEISSPSCRTFNTKLYGNRRLGGSSFPHRRGGVRGSCRR